MTRLASTAGCFMQVRRGSVVQPPVSDWHVTKSPVCAARRPYTAVIIVGTLGNEMEINVGRYGPRVREPEAARKRVQSVPQ